MAANSASKVSLKLLIDTRSNKVHFAEAGKDFVDFLFNLLSLPVGTVVKLLGTNSLVGSLGNIYESIQNLRESYMQPNQTKDLLLNPRAPISASGVPMFLAYDNVPRKTYTCSIYHRNMAAVPRRVCPHFTARMSNEVPIVARNVGKGESSGEGGFVKGMVTYMVMDDLTVKPMSIISIITMLHKFNVKEVGALQEKVVHLGMNEGLKLLKTSLQSKSVLTSVFLGNMRA
ncbi:hypothetical protein F3Y22_tig00112114pilonHSYRG00193 [Hibiscus syriacus]|uniref:DUF674 domain-containing protein n=1 Tax=Hibiscus syriacus TaxID=106335 RepID=A0A6A2Y4D9_HIBSY|nr:uncharacterized protein LOC120174608 [Hibiscus syriacus]KAE8670716.1 hypothetical protein F3Y22_tig00112114pilonHSYRG00193 [Hibiscus syriacus]